MERVLTLKHKKAKVLTATHTSDLFAKGEKMTFIPYELFDNGMYELSDAFKCTHVYFTKTKKKFKKVNQYRQRKGLYIFLAED